MYRIFCNSPTKELPHPPAVPQKTSDELVKELKRSFPTQQISLPARPRRNTFFYSLYNEFEKEALATQNLASKTAKRLANNILQQYFYLPHPPPNVYKKK